MKKHILITGGAGYIGSVLTSHLLGRGYQVTVIDCLLNDNSGGVLAHSYNENFMHFNVKVGEIESSSIFDWLDFHAVVHLAALLRPRLNHEQELKTTNSQTTRTIFNAAALARVEKFIFASTYFNYGEQPDSPYGADEKAESNPWDAYTESKVEDEQYIFSQMADYTIAPIALRFAQAHGLSSNMRWDLLVNRFVRDAMIKGKIVVFEKDVIRAFVHVYDIARAIEYVIRDNQCVSGGAPWGEALNVGGEHYTKDEIAKLIQQECHRPVEIEYSDRKTTNSMPGTKINFGKIKDRLGWEPIYSVWSSVTQMIMADKELGLF